MKRHAEVAGGGIGGLCVGMMLRSRGWTVRVHERSPEIRELGAGIYLKNNSISVLEEFGVFPSLAPRGSRLYRAEARDNRGRLLQTRPHDSDSTRVYVFSRQALIEELRDAALAAGVELVTSSQVEGADPAGLLILQDGSRWKADVVIGCDGFSSKVRQALFADATAQLLDTSIARYLIPHQRFVPDPITTEHYSGQRRIGVAPSGPNLTYVFTVCPHHDEEARRLPLVKENWTPMYPGLRELLDELAQTPATAYQYGIVKVPRWHRGRVALIGDSATGLPPTLGQGAGLTIMNARTLVEALDRASGVEPALAQWEQAVRFLSDMTQDWAVRWDWISRTCPPHLAWLRPILMGAMRAMPAIVRRMRIADRGLEVILPRVQLIRE